MRLTHRVHTDAPAAVVWELLADPTRWPELDPLLRHVRGVTGRVRPGQQLLAVGRPLALPVPLDVQEVIAGQRLAVTVYTAPGLREELTVELVAGLRGGTDVIVASVLAGAFARPAAPGMWLYTWLRTRLLSTRADHLSHRGQRPDSGVA